MNAYELADILQEYYDDFDGSFPALEKSIVMLRQQAERIERKQELIREQTALLVKQNNRIAELEKCLFQMQNACINLTQQSAEPFIWLKQDFDGEWIEVHPNKGIPLYTTPQIKELSDEEINAVYHEVWNSNKWSDVEGIDIEKFARAILKKANEK
jgi:hypothetical protein